MKLGIIGCGKMGTALLKGVLKDGVCAEGDVLLNDKIAAAVDAVLAEHPGAQAREHTEILAEADVVLLCVKPQDFPPTLQPMASLDGDPLFVSIAAGLSTEKIEAYLGGSRRVIRVMPNTPALVGKGASAFSLGTHATEADAEIAEKLLGAVGTVSRVPEKLIDAVTGVSGSGPAYIYTVIEALADGGVLMGLPKADALLLAAQTVSGAAEMVLQTGKHPAELRDMVTSPGGTTIAGLAKLEEHGIRTALMECVRASSEKAAELGRA